MSGRLDGKVVLVTGTGGGIGRATALVCAREGAYVIGCDLNPGPSEETVALVRDAGGRMDAVAPVDLSTEAGSADWVEQAVALGGGIDVLVNNASAIRFAPIAEMSYEDWSFTIRNELDIVFLVTKAAWPHLVARGGGSIVNIGSISGSRGAWFMPQNAHGAAKGGVLALTNHLVIEGGPHNIRVNAVSPAMTETPHTKPLVGGPGDPRAGAVPAAARTVGAARGHCPRDPLPRQRRGAARQRGEHPGRRRDGGRGMSVDVKGRLFLRGEDGYEQARVGRIFNVRRPDRFPAAVLEAADEADVVAGVRLAAERGWTVSVRAGGHSWAAWSLHDDALLIDLGAFRDLSYDETTGVVSAGPATQGALELTPFLTERGRAFPAGHCATVGIGGFLLQGGQGWNGRLKGWACESIVAVDVVTASGELVRASATENPDLYWAARGSGPGFPGVVTRFHLQTYEKPAAMWHDTWTFHLDDAEAVVHWLHSVLPSLDRRVEPVLAATRLPDVPLYDGVSHPGGTVLLLHTTCMADSDEEAQRLLGGLGECPVAGRELGRVTTPTSVAEESEAQLAPEPRAPSVRRRLHVVRRTGGRPRAAADGHLALARHRALVLDLVRLAPGTRPPRHGVLRRGQRLRGDVPRLHRSGRRREVPQPGARADRRDRARRRRRRLPR